MAFIRSIHVHAIHRSKSPASNNAQGVSWPGLIFNTSQWAVAVVAAHITPEVKRQAADKLAEWFD